MILFRFQIITASCDCSLKLRPRVIASLACIKAPFTRDQINLGPVPDWVSIGLAFTWDLLEPVRCGSTYLVRCGST